MKSLSSLDMARLSPIFPDLTPVQIQTVILYSCGLSREEVARIRNVSVPAVDKSLTACRRLLNVDSLAHIRAVVNVRLLISLMTKG